MLKFRADRLRQLVAQIKFVEAALLEKVAALSLTAAALFICQGFVTFLQLVVSLVEIINP